MKKVKNTIDLFNHFYQKNLKVIIIVNILVLFSLLFYCWPLDQFDILDYLNKSFFLFLFFLLMPYFAKFNTWDFHTSLTPIVSFSYAYSLCGITFIVFIASIIGIYNTVVVRDFSNTVLLVPSIIGLYTTSKSVEIYEKSKKENTLE